MTEVVLQGVIPVAIFRTLTKEGTHSHIPVDPRSVAKVPSNFVALTLYTRVLHFRFSQRYLLGLSNVRLPGLPSDISVNTYVMALRMRVRVCTCVREKSRKIFGRSVTGEIRRANILRRVMQSGDATDTFGLLHVRDVTKFDCHFQTWTR